MPRGGVRGFRNGEHNEPKTPARLQIARKQLAESSSQKRLESIRAIISRLLEKEKQERLSLFEQQILEKARKKEAELLHLIEK